jgi:hypothetical protein
MDPADSPAPQRRWWLRIAATFLAAVLLYVLSAGPVIGYLNYRWMRTGDIHANAEMRYFTFVLKVYRPVTLLIKDTALQKPFTNYLQWWVDFIREHMTPESRDRR